MRNKIITTLGWLISFALIASLFIKLDLHSLWKEFISAKWSYLIAAAVVNVLVVAMKATRWQWLMKPKNITRFMDIFKVTVIGMAGNNLLPARGGDWLKIYLLGKWESTCRTGLISVTGLDKLFDGLSILIMFGLMSLHSTFPGWVQDGTIIVSIVLLVMLVIIVLLLLHHRRTPSHLLEHLSHFRKFAKKLGAGLGALTDAKLTLSTLVLSIVICATQIVTIWLCQMAYGLHLDIWVPALVFVAINLAIMIPSAPSGVGPFEMAAVLAYTWLGVKSEVGLSVALMYHAVQFIPITLAGVSLYFAGTKRNKRIELEKAELIAESK